MTDVPAQSKSHTAVIKALRKLIDAEYPDGGWLPPGQEMAKRFGVSHPTYFKALKCMEEEGWVQSFPKRGHYATPAFLRHHKVGVIVGDGRLAPYLPDKLLECLGQFATHGYGVITILANSLEKLYDDAVVRDVEGLLWLSPPAKAAKAIAAIQAAGDMPLVLANAPRLAPVPSGVGRVDYDHERLNQAKAGIMWERGHRSLAYIGQHAIAESDGLVAALRALGMELDPTRCLPDIVGKPGELARMLRRLKFTGIIAEGGGGNINQLFAELSELPDATRPEVLVSYFPQLAQIGAMYPKVKLLNHQTLVAATPELEAAKMLVRHLVDGAPLGTMKIGLANQENNEKEGV